MPQFLSVALILLGQWAILSTPPDAMAEDPQSNPLETNKKINELRDEAKNLGLWDHEAQIITDAQANVFDRNGWNSESDQFSLELINQISQIEPWKTAEREDVFLSAIQMRYGLTQDQRDLMNREMRMETLKVSIKHFKDIAPVVMEIARARVQQEPFTAEQVQRWTANLKPIMDESLAAIERVQTKLEKTMTADQRKMLEADMKAVIKRHRDIEKMAKNWQAGKWNPTDWGLDNDPVHAGVMAEYRMKQAERNGLVELALLKKKPDVKNTSTDENSWERYVRWFCNFYKCTDRQRGIANAILKDSLKQARDYLHARQREIDAAVQLSQTAASEAKRKYHTSEAERLKKPIADIFQNLCNRLEKQLLTSEQQRLFTEEKTRRSASAIKTKSTAKK